MLKLSINALQGTFIAHLQSMHPPVAHVHMVYLCSYAADIDPENDDMLHLQILEAQDAPFIRVPSIVTELCFRPLVFYPMDFHQKAFQL